jgi:hypothetical protein
MKARSSFPFTVLCLVFTTGITVPFRAQSGPATAREAPGQEAAPARPAESDEFAQIDTDHDGRISPEEYAASPHQALERIAAGKRTGAAGDTGHFGLANNEGRPDRAKRFRKSDTNHDGYLSREELHREGVKPEDMKR